MNQCYQTSPALQCSSCKTYTFNEVVLLGVQSHQRTLYYKGVCILLLLEVMQPWATRAFRKMSWVTS